MKLSTVDFVFTTRIELDETNFIELREPNSTEIKPILSEESEAKQFELTEKLIPQCIVASSFTSDTDEASTGKEIFEYIKKSSSLCTEVVSTWIKSVPFQSRLKKIVK